MKSKLLPAVFCGACALVALESFFASRAHAQGNLTPPAGPAPSMVTLSELSKEIESLSKQLDARLPGGKNLAIAASNGVVSAWDHETGDWSNSSLPGVIGPLTESGGNFLFISSQGAATAWSSETKTWKSVNFNNANITQSGGSNGNFFITTNSGVVAGWNKTTGEWTTTTLGGILSTSASSEGNFLATTTNGVAAVWNQETGQWTSRNFNAALIPNGSD